MNLGALDVGILISFPVAGLRPLRAARLATANVPNPVIWTASPFFKAFVMTSIAALTARSASALVNPAVLAIASTNSVYSFYFSFLYIYKVKRRLMIPLLSIKENLDRYVKRENNEFI